MGKIRTTIVAVVMSFSASQLLMAADHEVGQKDKAFTASELKVKVGDTINFKNEDDFFHNIFSLSDAATFDLGSYPKGEHKGFTFDQAGTVEVECAIHPDMKMNVVVE